MLWMEKAKHKLHGVIYLLRGNTIGLRSSHGVVTNLQNMSWINILFDMAGVRAAIVKQDSEQ